MNLWSLWKRFEPQSLDAVPVLLRGEPEPINQWVRQWAPGRALLFLGLIGLGAGLFGAAVGWWRAPAQALFTAIKLPAILLLTTLCTALLNGMLAPLLGLNLSFRQSFQAILMSFALAAAILGSFSPLIFFALWNAPPISATTGLRGTAYAGLLLGQVAVIAFAGVAANLRLFQVLTRLSGRPRVARRILFAWLAGNLFLGSQFAWILRPFVGHPELPVQFLRADAFQGNFYEAVFRTFSRLLSS